MALTFTDWEHWTDAETGETGILDWTSADTLRHAPLRPVMEAIRQALAERQAVAGLAVSPVEPLVQSPALWTYANSLHNNAWALNLFQAFLNHTIGGGDFDGESTFTNWTLSALQTASGYTFSALSADAMTPAAWAHEMHAILSLLQWRVQYGCGPRSSKVAGSVSQRTYSDAISPVPGYWDLEPWYPAGPGGNTFLGRYSRVVHIPGFFGYSSSAWGVKGNGYVSGLYSGISHSGTWYLLSTTYFVDPDAPYPVTRTFDSESKGWADCINLWEDVSSPSTTSSRTSSTTIGDDSALPPFPPTELIGEQWTHYRGWAMIPAFVSKWNVPGGFVFQ